LETQEPEARGQAGYEEKQPEHATPLGPQPPREQHGRDERDEHRRRAHQKGRTDISDELPGCHPSAGKITGQCRSTAWISRFLSSISRSVRASNRKVRYGFVFEARTSPQPRPGKITRAPSVSIVS